MTLKYKSLEVVNGVVTNTSSNLIVTESFVVKGDGNVQTAEFNMEDPHLTAVVHV